MKQIEAFIDLVYHNVRGNKEDIQELKAEMKSHLLEAVHELKSEGKSEQEAIEIAIERFGGEKEMHRIVGELFKAQKIFAKWVLFIAITCLTLAFIINGTLVSISKNNMHEQSVIGTQILDKLVNKQFVSQELKKEIKKLVNGSNSISGVRIYNVKGINESEVNSFVNITKPDFEYNQIEKETVITTVLSNFRLSNVFHLQSGGPDWYVDIAVSNFENAAVLIFFIGTTIYWALFSIWAIINAYHQKRLNLSWIVAFSVFNVLAFLVFRLSITEKKKYAK